MIEVFVENASGSFLLEEDGRLSLKSLKLDPDTITIQGRREQVGPDGMTKRSWTELKQVLLELGESDELGTKDVPLKVAGNPLAGGFADCVRLHAVSVGRVLGLVVVSQCHHQLMLQASCCCSISVVMPFAATPRHCVWHF